MSFSKLHFWEPQRKSLDRSFSELCITSIVVGYRKSATNVNCWVIPQRLGEDGHSARREYATKMLASSRILNDVVQNTESNNQVEALIRVSKILGIHLIEPST